MAGVVAAGCVAKERSKTDGRVVEASGIQNERVITQERVAVAEVAALLTNSSRLRHKRKAGQRQEDEQECDRPPLASQAVHEICCG